jgi:hypothetical protein
VLSEGFELYDETRSFYSETNEGFVKTRKMSSGECSNASGRPMDARDVLSGIRDVPGRWQLRAKTTRPEFIDGASGGSLRGPLSTSLAPGIQNCGLPTNMSDDHDEPDDLIQETMGEIISEAQVVPTGLEFPKEVIAAIEAYEKTHSIDRDELIDEAFEAAKERMDESSETFARMMEDPDLFEWPIQNPLLCVVLAFMRKTTQRWVEKMDKKRGVDKEEPADWWKGEM